jgi:peptidoglycan/xylan/chitin deacetylase (PgdA/CDA1 family)
MPVLMYHRIADDGPEGLARWRVTPADFERQLAWLADSGFTTSGLDDWHTASQRDPTAVARRVVLTFDDAYRDFVTTAFPLLQLHGFGATMFVPTGFMGGAAEWDQEFGPPAALMSWQELDSLVAAGVEIGAHTVTHPRLDEIADEATIAAEVTGSREVLEARYRQPIPTFAYPYGRHDERVAGIVADAGFHLAVTIEPASAGPFALGRLGIYGTESFDAFVAKVIAAT